MFQRTSSHVVLKTSIHFHISTGRSAWGTLVLLPHLASVDDQKQRQVLVSALAGLSCAAAKVPNCFTHCPTETPLRICHYCHKLIINSKWTVAEWYKDWLASNVLVVYDMLRHCNRQLSNIAYFQTKRTLLYFYTFSILTLSTVLCN